MDHLEWIKINQSKYYVSNRDADWLIAEVERLREARITELPSLSEDLEAIFARSVDRDRATQKDIDWLIGQVAMLRQQTEQPRAARITDLEQLLDQARRSSRALGSFDPNSPAHGALRMLAQSINHKLKALRGKEGDGGN
jgi:hypothetical protein